MGSGKSTVGRMLAAQLAWHFTDLDAEIERGAGLSISQIFAQKGEAVFRVGTHEHRAAAGTLIVEGDSLHGVLGGKSVG